MLDRLRATHDIRTYVPLNEATARVAELGVRLPSEHATLLTRTDGLTGYGGYFRILGLGEAVVGLARWNDRETWRFAWSDRLDEFFFFGESAWGDQYAYRRNDLAGGTSAPVYVLDAIVLEPRRVADTFEDFVVSTFPTKDGADVDAMIVHVRRRLGDLTPDEHVVQMPSVLLGGEERPENVHKMRAGTSMIVAGDLATQLVGQPRSREVARLDTYVDHRGRTRLRVVWHDASTEGSRSAHVDRARPTSASRDDPEARRRSARRCRADACRALACAAALGGAGIVASYLARFRPWVLLGAIGYFLAAALFQLAKARLLERGLEEGGELP